MIKDILIAFPDGTPIVPWFTDETAIAHREKFDVTEFHVYPDRPDLLQTEAIQKVIDHAALHGGGEIFFPAGCYLSGSLFFRTGTSLYLDKDATLLGSKEICDFTLLPTRMEGENVNYFAALINADKVDRFTISGHGVIDGNGLDYWRHFWLRRRFNPDCTNMDEMRPRLIYISNCCDVEISGVTLRNSPFWTSHFFRCQRLKLTGVTIFAPAKPVPSPSTDGVDLDVCSQVLIQKCYFSTNDDAIALKGGKGPGAEKQPENGGNTEIIIDECDFGYCHSALTCGSETLYNRNIIFNDCHINGAARLFFLKMRPDTLQRSEYIQLRNLHGNCGQVLLANSWTQFRRCSELYPSEAENICFDGLRLNCDEICHIAGEAEYTLKNIIYRNCRFNVSNVISVVMPHADAFIFENCVTNGTPFVGFQSDI